MLPNPSDLENLTRQLVLPPSVTGTTTAAAGWTVHNEALLAEWIHAWLESKGVPSLLQDLDDGRKNVFAFVRGASARTIVLMGHFDTVPPSPGQVLSGLAAGDDAYLFGRGSLDMKSGIAVVMSLMAGWAKPEKKPDVSVLFVATCDDRNCQETMFRERIIPARKMDMHSARS